MKRPEGFDRSTGAEPVPAPQKSGTSAKPTNPEKQTKPANPGAQRAQTGAPRQLAGAPVRTTRSPKPAKVAREARPEKPAKPDRVAGPDRASARRDVRKAAAARRRYERGEVRRFTRRSRRRRVTWLVALSCVILLGGFVTAAVYSPLLSLKNISITGTSRIDKTQLLGALDGQLGTPLALVDFTKMRAALSKFPLIRSYVTESVPPDTLVIRVTERAPIAAIQTATGFSIVDPAGVVIQESTDRPKGMPLVTAGAAITTSSAFAASVEVILALPPTLATTVDSITAATKDDVTLTLVGGQKVVWGSNEQSALKARVLADLIKAQSGTMPVTYNVSAPTNPVIGPG